MRQNLEWSIYFLMIQIKVKVSWKFIMKVITANQIQ